MSQTTKAAARLLKSARALIEKPENWVKGTYSRYVEGRHCYCMVGALDMAVANSEDDTLHTGSPLHQIAISAMQDALYDSNSDAAHEGLTVPDFNDAAATTHEDVLRVYDLAIETLEAE